MILRAVFVVAVECPLAPFELAVWLSLSESVGIPASTTTELIKDSFRGVVIFRSSVAFLVGNGAGQHDLLPHVICPAYLAKGWVAQHCRNMVRGQESPKFCEKKAH